MKATIEKVTRGTPEFPLDFIRQKGTLPDACITPLHYHNDLEILFCLEGSTRVFLDGDVLRTCPGQLYFISSGQIHGMYVEQPPSRYDCLVLPRRLLELPPESLIRKQLLSPLYSGKLRFPTQSADPELIALFRQISELCADRQKNAPLITAQLLVFLALCQQKGLLQPGTETAAAPLHKALDYMGANYSQKLTLDGIAASAGMSPKYFCTYFKKHTGSTPIGYLTALRIRHAQVQLLQGASVLEAASACGFENVSFFIQKFKEATGCTPGQYRARQQKPSP